jgi:hypothetical protein
MTEKQRQLEAYGRLALVAVCAGLYAWGGMETKALRRFVAPALCGVGCFILSRDWRYVLQMPLMMFSLSLGYGGDFLWAKIIKRGIFGLANGLSGSLVDILSKRWLLVALWTTILIIAYVGLGVFSLLPNARIEELCLGVLVFLKPVMSARR